MASPNDLRRGSVIMHQNAPYSVMEVVHRANGRGRGFVQAKMRNLQNGSSTDVKFDSGDPITFCDTSNQTLEFSYIDEVGFHFMDPATFEDIVLPANVIGEDKYYLVPTTSYDIRWVNEKPIAISLPGSVELEVLEAPEVIRGDTANNVLKTVTTETGLEVKAPAFVKQGDRIKVSTADGSYISRA
jgi:elongation factor P